MKDKIAITLTSFAKYDTRPLTLLYKKGFEVRKNVLGRKLNREETFQMTNGCIGAVAGTEIYEEEMLKRISGLKVISRCGTGTDSINLETAEKLGIKIFNTPDAPALAVSELTLGLMLGLLRKIPFMDRKMRANLWNKEMGCLLCGKQVGIVGFGRIGRKVAGLVKSLGSSVFYFDPFVKETPEFPRLGFEELLKKSDVISLHLSYSKETHNMFGQNEFLLIKDGAFLINCSRGGIVDENALYTALKTGKIAGAAVDVFEREPYNGPLKDLDNVILTPHIGSYAKEARIAMEIQAVENLLNGLKSEENKG